MSNHSDHYRLLNTEQLYAADAQTTRDGTPGFKLMTNAARVIADCVVTKFSDCQQIAIICGKGNNGGDGFVAARLLVESGRNVTVFFAGSPSDMQKLSGDAALAASSWKGSLEFIGTNALPDFSFIDLIVDAILGAGINRAPDASVAKLITHINQSQKNVLSVDLPTGVCGNTGQIFGAAICAAMTVTFFCKKPGHVLLPGKTNCGEVLVHNIGIDVNILKNFNPAVYENNPSLWLHVYPFPEPQTHKYQRGHALVLSGHRHATGAARLAATAALRSGAGVVSLGSPAEAMDINAMHLTEIMQYRIDNTTMLQSVLQDQRLNSLTIGPGFGYGEQTTKSVLAALSSAETKKQSPDSLSERTIVLDADALSSFEHAPDTLFSAIKNYSAPVVLTPHLGELSRLFLRPSPGNKTTSKSKIELTREAAKTSGAIVVVKGNDTVISAPDGTTVINSNAPPWLATAGSGDVLAGTICGLLCQGSDVKMTKDDHIEHAFQLTCAAVWVHAQAANLQGVGLIASDIYKAYPQVLSLLLRRKTRDGV